MYRHYSIRKIQMYYHLFLFIAFVLLITYSQSEAFKQETRGYFAGQKNNEITIVLLQNRGRESFRVNDHTTVINVGMPMKVSKIPRNSVVKVTSEGSVALEILVEEVPK